MSQGSRRENPYPWTWEVPLGVAVAVLALFALGVQLGRSIANGLTGIGWFRPVRGFSRACPACCAAMPAPV